MRAAVVVAVGGLAVLAALALTVIVHEADRTTSLLQRGVGSVPVSQGGLAAARVREVATRLRSRISKGQRQSVSLASHMRGGFVHSVRKKALSVPSPVLKSGSRETELATAPAKQTKLPAAEEARCIGMLHACQSWLELKDGDKNNIVITSPDDDTKELLNKDVVLPGSGQPIPDKVWDILKDSCKYGLSDLRQCDKPSHWPVCTGSACTGKNAKKSKASDHAGKPHHH